MPISFLVIIQRHKFISFRNYFQNDKKESYWVKEPSDYPSTDLTNNKMTNMDNSAFGFRFVSLKEIFRYGSKFKPLK